MEIPGKGDSYAYAKANRHGCCFLLRYCKFVSVHRSGASTEAAGLENAAEDGPETAGWPRNSESYE
jgi:hypothetical protein